MEDNKTKMRDAVCRYLACPRCHSLLIADDQATHCLKCDFPALIKDGVVLAKPEAAPSFFDDKHQVMHEGNQSEGSRDIFYDQQAKRVVEIIKPNATILDVGCGPAVPYPKQSGWFVIGLDPSFESVRSNNMVDLRVYGSAEALPIPDHSIDAVVCFYSIHHMTGQSISENRKIVNDVFHEFQRVIRPGGNLLIFDLSPWWPFSTLENLTWNAARGRLGAKLDMFFWEATRLEDLGRAIFPRAKLEIEHFAGSLFTTFPPVFSIPALKIPRLLYPFEINLYNWRF